MVEYRKILTHHFENDLISILERLETPQLYDRYQIHLMKKFTFQKGPLSFTRGRKSRLSLKPGSSQPKNYPVPFEKVWDGVKIPPKIHECTINNDVIKARSSCSHKCGPKCNRYCKSDEFINSICSLDGSGESFPDGHFKPGLSRFDYSFQKSWIKSILIQLGPNLAQNIVGNFRLGIFCRYLIGHSRRFIHMIKL